MTKGQFFLLGFLLNFLLFQIEHGPLTACDLMAGKISTRQEKSCSRLDGRENWSCAISSTLKNGERKGERVLRINHKRVHTFWFDAVDSCKSTLP